MKVLLSIKPEYAEKILSGEKHYEFRKSIFKNSDVDKVIIYATKPLGKVIGEFDIDHVMQDNPDKIWKMTKNFSGITYEFFNQYFQGKSRAFAIKVKNPSTYSNPIELSEILPSGIAPQSFCYIR